MDDENLSFAASVTDSNNVTWRVDVVWCCSAGLGASEQTAVHGVNHGLRSDSATSEEATIEPLQSLLTALNTMELDVDIAIVRIKSTMQNLSILLLALSANLVLKRFLPIWA
jgi:hypothetical protein